MQEALGGQWLLSQDPEQTVANARHLERRKEEHAKALGAFYTPIDIAEALAHWAIQSGHERVLEPSVGDGALVAAAVARAAEVGGGASRLQVTACDIDPAAIRAVSRRLPDAELYPVDFLTLDPGLAARFDAIIANPPFTRNHDIEAVLRSSLRRRFRVGGAAGLWTYFLIHAMSFLATGGRLAAVVPASATFSNYGRTTLARLAKRFARLELCQITGKPAWVNGAQERGALVLASGYLEGSSTVPAPVPWPTVPSSSRMDEGSGAYSTLLDASTPLGEMATLRIGAVTGCNRVFLLNEDERNFAGIRRSDVVPIVGRARQVPGLTVSTSSLRDKASQGDRTLLLAPQELGRKGSPVRNRLATISPRVRAKTLWFKKRDPWWRVQIGQPADALFTYMNDLGPRLVLAQGQVRSTNTLHQVFFKKNTTRTQRMAAALSTISTFGQLAAERVGRSYGGGLLKFELTDARRMPVLPAEAAAVHRSFPRADVALRSGDLGTAGALADEAVVAPLLGPGWRPLVEEMRLNLLGFRAARRGK